jgi:hypothetical protein
MIAAGVVLAVGLSVGSLPLGAADKEGGVVELDGLRSKAPAEWKQEEPSSEFRFAQFKLPAKKDDKRDAELLIFKGFGGSAKQNVERWKKQFLAPEGKSIDDVSRVEEITIAGHPATYLDISGTYLDKKRPMDPPEKAEKREEYRMLAVHFEGPTTTFHIKLTGPAKTVEAYKKGFDEWLKGFKK